MNFKLAKIALLALIFCFQGATAQAQGGQGGMQGGRGQGGQGMMQGNMQQDGMQGNNMQGNYQNMQQGNMQGNVQVNYQGTRTTTNNTLPTSAPFPYPETEVDAKSEFQGPFYFVDESPIQILKILEILTGKSILQPPNLPNVKINFTSKDKIKTDEAILLLESLLSMNGIAIIPMGDVLKAVSISGVTMQSPEFIEGDVLKMPPSQKFYSKIYKLQYQDISTAQTLLSSLFTSGGIASYVAFTRTNSFMLTDTLVNHQRLQRLLNEVDVEAEIAEEMAFIELKNTSASDMQTSLKSISGNLLKRYFENTIIEADDRTNQLIVFARKGNMKYIKQFVEGFDIEAEPLTKSEVFYIKHGEAEDVADAINSIIDGQQSASSTLTKTQAVTRDTTIEASRAGINSTATGISNSVDLSTPNTTTTTTVEQKQRELMFSSYVTLVSDERSNSILVHGTKSDIKNVKDLIDKIDVVLRQVRIDIIIAEVSLSENEVSGLSSFGLGLDTDLITAGTTVGGFSATTQGETLNDTPSFQLSATESSFQAIFNIAQEKSNVKLLSNPTIVTAHNKVGMVNISTSYPTITSSISSVTDVGTTQNSVDYQDIGITLTVTPLIGDNGMVQLEITQTANTIQGYTTISGNDQVVIGKREAESFLSVQSGNIIVLGGMKEISSSHTDSKVWLLGDIPLLGELFKPKDYSDSVSEIIMFIRPTIIDSVTVADVVTNEELNPRSGQIIKDYLETGEIEEEAVKQIKADRAAKALKEEEARLKAAEEAKQTSSENTTKTKSAAAKR